MFKDIKEMGEVSQLLDENGVHYYEMNPTKIKFYKEDDLKIASSILEDYDVELVLKEDAIKSGTYEDREVFKTTVGLRDLLGIFRSVK